MGKNAAKGAGVGAVGGVLITGALVAAKAIVLTNPVGWGILLGCIVIGAIAGAVAGS